VASGICNHGVVIAIVAWYLEYHHAELTLMVLCMIRFLVMKDRYFNFAHVANVTSPTTSPDATASFATFETQVRDGLRALIGMAGLHPAASATTAAPPVEESIRFDVGLWNKGMTPAAITVLQRVVSATQWLDYNHHLAHAAIGYV
jgi:hypothetical protein